MKAFFKASVVASIACAAGLVGGNASAQTQVAQAPIKAFNAGWGTDEFNFSTGVTATNPAACTYSDLYDVTSANGGYKSLLATALTAVSMGTNVTIVVSNTTCSPGGRPLIIGLTINP